MEYFVWKKVSLWVSEFEKLSRIARFLPQAAHVVFAHGSLLIVSMPFSIALFHIHVYIKYIMWAL